MKKADEVYIWSDVINLGTDDIERMVSEEVPKEYEKLLAQKGKLDFTLSSICADTMESSLMKKFLKDFKEKEVEIYVEWLIKQFQYSIENNDYTEVYQYLCDITALFQKLQRSGKTDIVMRFSKFLCNELLLPIGSVSEIQYHCCQRSYALSMTYFPEKYSAFLQEYKIRCAGDHMFLNRLKYIKQDYDRVLMD